MTFPKQVLDTKSMLDTKYIDQNVNKVQISQTYTVIFDLTEKMKCVFYRYNGSNFPKA
jgi:hypothetical protein